MLLTSMYFWTILLTGLTGWALMTFAQLQKKAAEETAVPALVPVRTNNNHLED